MNKKMNDPGYNSKRNRFPALLATLMVLTISAPAGAHEAHDQEVPFITIWKTDNRATWRDDHLSGDDQIRIPGIGDEYTIEWEKVERVNDSWQAADDSLRGVGTGSDALTITFPEPGHYRVKISGDFREIRFKGERHDDIMPTPEYIYEYGDAEKLIEIEQWGDISWASMESAFYRALNLRVTAVDAPDLSQVSNMSEMFYHARSVNADFSHWDVSNVANMSSMFRFASSFNGNLSSWDVSSVTNMEMMFYVASSFNSDISGWDVGNVTNMRQTFARASSFSGDLSGWDVSNVRNMIATFFDAFSFNSDISGWDVGNVKYMSSMFASTLSFNGDLSRWDVGNVTDMSFMFRFASSFNGDLSDWDVSNVTNLEGVFHGAVSFNGDVSNWNVSKVTNLARAFYVASSFNVDVSNWDVGNVTNMRRMFQNASSFNQDLGGWNVSKVKDMSSMFSYATSFNGNMSSWDVGNVLRMHSMFHYASLFNGDLSNWDVSNVTNMIATFAGASSFDQDLSRWDMSNVTETNRMLSGSGLSVENYDKTLIGWSEQELTPGLTLGADSLRFCHSAEQRQYIIDNFEWKIIDAGIDDDCKVASSIEAEDKPQEFELKQNYPNPFNPVTVIPFSMAESGQVRLEVYDMLGRRMGVLVNGPIEAGRHEARWDGSSAASGVYLVRMTVDALESPHRFQFTRQVMLVK